MLKVVFGDTSPWAPVFVATSVSKALVRFCRAPPTVLPFVSRVKGGNAGPRSGHGVKDKTEDKAEEKSKKKIDAWELDTIILNE